MVYSGACVITVIRAAVSALFQCLVVLFYWFISNYARCECKVFEQIT